MTRDAEHTPSPQSVVVPLEDWRHVIGALKNAKARLPMGAAIGNVSDALSKVEHLQAAPAPSSLAGGAVREKVARIVDPETFALIAHYTGIERFDGLSPAEREPSVFKAYPDLKTARDAAYADADAILAALSPEAPALEGVEWFGVTGAADETEALAVALFDVRCPGIRMTDEDLHYYRAAAQRAMQAVAEELDTPAPTPRHEASTYADELANESLRRRDAEFGRHEAPAEPSDAIEHPLYTVSEAARRQLVKAAGWIEKEAYDASGNDDPEDEGLDEAAAWLRSTFDLSDTALGIVRNASDEIVSIGHEAPAADWDAIRSHPCYDEHQAGCDCVIPAQSKTEVPPFLERMTDVSVEAPAEGAGERECDGCDGDRCVYVGSLCNPARSSAPEAREGEAVGWKYEVFGPEGRSRSVRSVIGPKPNVAAPVGGYVLYDALYTHPAAPSADKLRDVLIDLTSWFTKPVQGQSGMVWVIPAGEMGADDAVNAALAALKAEGGK